VNTPTLIASLIMAALLVLLIGFLIRRMMQGWLHRAQRQAKTIGRLPALRTPLGRDRFGHEGVVRGEHDRCPRCTSE